MRQVQPEHRALRAGPQIETCSDASGALPHSRDAEVAGIHGPGPGGMKPRPSSRISKVSASGA